MWMSVGFVRDDCAILERRNTRALHEHPQYLAGTDLSFNHMRRRAIVALALGAAAGCGPAEQAPSDQSAPTLAARAADGPAGPAAAPRDAINGANEEVTSERAREAALLKELSAAAKREGSVLTLFAKGQAIARFTDADAPWVLAGTLKMPGPNGERLFFKVRLIDIDEEGRSDWIDLWFDPAGQFISSDVVLGQNPGRSMIAAGYYEGGDLSVGPSLSLMDWAGDPKFVYPFKSPCYPIKWVSDNELEAACPYQYVGNTPGDDEIIPARVVRTGPREWRLQQAGLPTRNMPNPPQTAPFDETVAATEISSDPKYEAFLSEAGYVRLGR